MEDQPALPITNSGLSRLKSFSSNQVFLGILISSVILGVLAGYLLADKQVVKQGGSPQESKKPASAQQDTRTFRDFAEGTIQKRPAPKKAEEYVEGTHLLVREGGVPVALTSSVVDLSQYEGKKVKVFGETQKAIKEGWLMDVGKVETKN